MNRQPGKFVWHEHVSTDPGAAQMFYEQWLGWRTASMDIGGHGYALIRNGDAGIGGYRPAPDGVPSHWHAYVSVDDVDALAQRAQAAGARLLMPATDFGPIGRAATLADPTGAIFSLWKATAGDEPDVELADKGAWCWDELTTTDDTVALAFYETVFGYTHSTMEGSEPPYHMLSIDGRQRAGLMRAPMPGIPSAWVSYVHVADIDDTTARARELGASVLVEPMDIPNGFGRFAVIADPLGCVIGLFRPGPG
ncbi:MAG: VOC family protein [Burkholderiaceae bacterium]